MAGDLKGKTDWTAVITGLAGAGDKGFDEKAFAQLLKSKVIGQDQVADEVANQIKRRLSQAKMSATKLENPLGVFLLAGAPGVGKTYFCKVLAENMYDGNGMLEHIDMTQFAQGHSKSSLVGSSLGYTGGQGSLTRALKENPKLIVLLDEFEKAHSEVHKIFLTAWNDGFITDLSTSERIPTTKALFLLTTNAAMDRLQEIEAAKDSEGARYVAITGALKQAGFAPEVLSRIDHFFVFASLDRRNTAKMVDLEIQRVALRYGITVSKVDPAYLLDMLAQTKEFQDGGARILTRMLDRELGGQFIELGQRGVKEVEIAFENGRPKVIPTHPA